jgi:hypothetical protein
MTRLKRIAYDLALRLVIITTFIFYPLLALLALPWAWFDSLDSWGYTTLESWRAGWNLYSRDSLIEAWRELIKPIGTAR